MGKAAPFLPLQGHLPLDRRFRSNRLGCFAIVLLALGWAITASAWMRCRKPVNTPASPEYSTWLEKVHTAIDRRRSVAFDKIYSTDSWNLGSVEPETRAGPGSTIRYTQNVREFLGNVISTYNISTVVDMSCSEMLWQPHIPGFESLEQFTGYDIVPDAISAARQRLSGASNVELAVRDMVNDVLDRSFDLVIVRDTFFHLPITDALVAIAHINDSGSKYLGTTTIDDDAVKNAFVSPGEWYPLNVRKMPFMFPPALDMAQEGFAGTDYYGSKKFGIWKLPIQPDVVLGGGAKESAVPSGPEHSETAPNRRY